MSEKNLNNGPAPRSVDQQQACSAPIGWWEVSNLGEALQCWDALSNTKEPENFSYMTDHRHTSFDVCWALFEKLKAGLPEADRARCEPNDKGQATRGA